MITKPMKRNIRVYLQYPWRLKDSPYYKYLLENPPKEMEYTSTKKEKGVILNKKYFFLFGILKKIVKKILKVSQLETPNAHLTKTKEKYDLIHCAHCLSQNKNQPWVADIEMYGSLFIANKRSEKLDQQIKEIILRKNCKKIIPWSEGIKNSILRYIPQISNKMEVVYPAIPSIKNLKKKSNKNQTILFIGRYFKSKGGLMALEVIEQLRKKHNINGIIVSSVPKKIKKKYSHLNFYELMPQKKLFNLMQKTDILLYPSMSETFGFGLLEAMSFGIPIVTINTPHTNSLKEIIEDKKHGLVLDIDEKYTKEVLKIPFNKTLSNFEKELIRELIKNCEKLILDKSLWKKMSLNCIKEISKGKFSIKERNKKLLNIYREALK